MGKYKFVNSICSGKNVNNSEAKIAILFELKSLNLIILKIIYMEEQLVFLNLMMMEMNILQQYL